MALTLPNGAPAKMGIGRYSLRNNRVAEITGSHIETGVLHGHEWTKQIWDGVLFTTGTELIESKNSWTDLGGFVHESDGASGLDIVKVIWQAPEPEVEEAKPAVLENQLLCAALVQRLSAVTKDGEGAVDTLNRVICERDQAQAQIKELLAQHPVA